MPKSTYFALSGRGPGNNDLFYFVMMMMTMMMSLNVKPEGSRLL